ncbi:MAG: anthranilate phosphoribosyltransferase [Candidatus Omnitrophota bacterium]
MIKEAIARLIEQKDLTADLMSKAQEEIMKGEALPSQIAAFLVALRFKGETIEEITAGAQIMRKYATKIKSADKGLLDTCGTGGDESGTFNISTLSALVACGAGITVAKHGNKSVSSRCGSADLLIELGVQIDLTPAQIEECMRQAGFGFLYAPLLHQAMKYAAPVRRELGIRTIFNILGPLTNPAGAACQLLGVYDQRLTEVLARTLKNLGARHVLVVHGEDGLDEVTTTGYTQVAELKGGKVKVYKIYPADFGIKKAGLNDLRGGDAKDNAKIAEQILKGAPGPQRDIVLLNAGCAIYAADRAGSIKEGIEQARTSIDTQSALHKLELLREVSNKCR